MTEIQHATCCDSRGAQFLTTQIIGSRHSHKSKHVSIFILWHVTWEYGKKLYPCMNILCERNVSNLLNGDVNEEAAWATNMYCRIKCTVQKHQNQNGTSRDGYVQLLRNRL